MHEQIQILTEFLASSQFSIHGMHRRQHLHAWPK
jgi:hypothetical protein